MMINNNLIFLDYERNFIRNGVNKKANSVNCFALCCFLFLLCDSLTDQLQIRLISRFCSCKMQENSLTKHSCCVFFRNKKIPKFEF